MRIMLDLHRRQPVCCLGHLILRCFVSLLQQWDINEKLPAEVEGPFHVAVATNVLHTGNNLKSES